MRSIATLVLGLLMLASASTAFAQAQPLGDEFVFFVEGVNPAVPSAAGTVVPDPADANNKVLSFAGGNYANPALQWDAMVGVDMSANRIARDTLFLRLRMGPGTFNASSRANVGLMLLDTQSLNNNGDPGDDDIAFRAVWPIPDSLFDNEWHDLAIALPPATVAALDSAKVDKDVNGNPLAAENQYDVYAKNWVYQGGYNPDGFTFVTPGSGLFKEFEWNRVQNIGFFWDQGSGPGGNILVDDFYIGSVNTDLSGFKGAGAPYSGTATVTDNGDSSVKLTFTPQAGVGGYRVYLVEDENTPIDSDNAQFVRSFAAGASDLSLTYKLRSPHPSAPSPTATFAITATSTTGIENTTPVYASGSVVNARPQGFVFGMTPAEVDGLFNAFTNRQLTTSFLDLSDVTPFVLSPTSGTAENPDRIAAPGDFTAMYYMGFAPDPDDANETIVMIYGDITDDAMVFDSATPEGKPTSTEPYLFDRTALFFGAYRVPFPIGSSHGGMVPGEDYAMNFQPLNDVGGQVIVDASIAASDLFSAPLFKVKADGSGYEVLAAFLMSELGNPTATPPAPAPNFVRPNANEIAYYPLIFGYDEQDGGGGFDTRTNVVSSEKANVNFTNPGWYASPLQWPAVAFAGVDVVSTDAEDGETTAAFALHAPAPSPAATQARVRFTLDQAGPVRLDVFNVLGQRVATLADATMAAGDHAETLQLDGLASGLYMVRLTASGRVATQSLVVAK